MSKFANTDEVAARRRYRALEVAYGGGTRKQIKAKILSRLQSECLKLGQLTEQLEQNLKKKEPNPLTIVRGH